MPIGALEAPGYPHGGGIEKNATCKIGAMKRNWVIPVRPKTARGFLSPKFPAGSLNSD